MKKNNIIRYLIHVGITIVAALAVGLVILLSQNGSVNYGDNPMKINLEEEGPHVYYTTDSTLTVNYLHGNKEQGFYTSHSTKLMKDTIQLDCYFPLDSSRFSFEINPIIENPPSLYDDSNPILAISDIEGGYNSLRDFLINNRVIDHNLKWTFGRGHLVLLGDLMDRGFSVTQVLWFVYKLEQEAKLQGGTVHVILGNHELYNLQGKYKSAAYKYYAVASIQGIQIHELYDNDSFIGRWLASKNTFEKINDCLFVHGGVHPDILLHNSTIEQLNEITRSNIRLPFYPTGDKALDQVILSHRDGLCWYRGYFDGKVSPEQLELTLQQFDAQAIIVGHTLQAKVKKLYDGKLYAIDVNHPKDYRKSWPNKKSEGLLIQDGRYSRVLHDGKHIGL